MEKLIELLNEYEWQESWSYSKEYWIYIWWGDSLDYECFICSKKFWFIKWLVENDKIDLDKFKYHIKYEDEERETNPTFIDELIMILSISNAPIEYLCLLLK